MAFIDTLLEQGYTFPGTPRKQINTDTGQMGYEQTSTMAKLVKGLQTFMLQRQQQQEKLQKEQLRKIDMYKTLREAGYDSKSAHDAVMSGRFPEQAGGESLKQQQEKATLDLTQTKTKQLKEGKVGTSDVKVVGNSLVRYNPDTKKAEVLYKGTGKNQVIKTGLGGIIEYNPDTGKVKKLTDEVGNLLSSTQDIQSPYPEYPDAFQENGVWKVMRNGQKYKIEE